MSAIITAAEVSSHSSESNIYVIIHCKVYDLSVWINQHPGGREVLLDVGGRDATEAFEDVGHSEEAHDILEGLIVGTLKGDLEAKTGGSDEIVARAGGKDHSSSGPEFGVALYTFVLIVAALALGTWNYLQN